MFWLIIFGLAPIVYYSAEEVALWILNKIKRIKKWQD
jgi:hypothetical protein